MKNEKVFQDLTNNMGLLQSKIGLRNVDHFHICTSYALRACDNYRENNVDDFVGRNGLGSVDEIEACDDPDRKFRTGSPCLASDFSVKSSGQHLLLDEHATMKFGIPNSRKSESDHVFDSDTLALLGTAMDQLEHEMEKMGLTSLSYPQQNHVNDFAVLEATIKAKDGEIRALKTHLSVLASTSRRVFAEQESEIALLHLRVSDLQHNTQTSDDSPETVKSNPPGCGTAVRVPGCGGARVRGAPDGTGEPPPPPPSEDQPEPPPSASLFPAPGALRGLVCAGPAAPAAASRAHALRPAALAPCPAVADRHTSSAGRVRGAAAGGGVGPAPTTFAWDACRRAATRRAGPPPAPSHHHRTPPAV